MPRKNTRKKSRGKFKYRARGHYKPTNRNSWITTVWRNTRKEAQDDIKMFAPATRSYSKTWVEKRKR